MMPQQSNFHNFLTSRYFPKGSPRSLGHHLASSLIRIDSAFQNEEVNYSQQQNKEILHCLNFKQFVKM